MCERAAALTGPHCRIRTGVPAGTLAAIEETTSLSIRMQPCEAAVPSGPAPGPRGLGNLVGDLERPLDAAQIPAGLRWFELRSIGMMPPAIALVSCRRPPAAAGALLVLRSA
jgi:hypothetical protein